MLSSIRTGLGNWPQLTQGATSNIRPPVAQSPQSTDVVQFSGVRAKDYGIDPRQVKVILPTGVTLPKGVGKLTLLEKLLAAHELALVIQKEGTLSGKAYGSNALNAAGQWALGANLEHQRELTVCGERTAISNSLTQYTSKFRPKDLETDAQVKKFQAGKKIKLIALANAQSVGWVGKPCGECQEWLATDRYLGSDVLLASLEKDPQDQSRYVIKVRTVGDLLPKLAQQKAPSKTGIPVEFLPPIVSSSAAKVLAQLGLTSERDIKQKAIDLIKIAQGGYLTNKTAVHSNQNEGAAVLLSNGKTYRAQRLDFTARWHQDGDLAAATYGLQDSMYRDMRPSRITAIAYIGDDMAPKIKNLGYFAQPKWGGADTLIFTVQNKQILINTIEDYLPVIHLSENQRPAT